MRARATTLPQLRRSLIVYTTVGAFVIALVSSISVAVPLYNSLIHLAENEHTGEAVGQAEAIQKTVTFVTRMAAMLSGRSESVQPLLRYYDGNLSHAGLVSRQRAFLTDSIWSDSSLNGVRRLDHEGKLIVSVGVTLPNDIEAPVADEFGEPAVIAAREIGDELGVIVASPIKDHLNEYLGVDLMMFTVSDLMRSMRVGMMTKSSVSLVTNEGGNIGMMPIMAGPSDTSGDMALAVPSGIAGKLGGNAASGTPFQDSTQGKIYDYQPVRGTPWGVLLETGTSEIYGKLKRDVVASIAVILALTAFSALTINALVRPLAGGMFVQADSLYRKIKEKNLALLRLKKSSDALEQANRSKSDFLETMSHELRTPLNAIIGYSEMLEDEAIDRDQKEMVPDINRIRQAGHRILGMVTNVLEMTQLESGRVVFKREVFDIATLLEAVVGAQRENVENNSNRISLSLHGELGTMYADQSKIRVVLEHLVANAAKFTRNGYIVVSARRTDFGERDEVSFTISDTGIGIDKEQLAHIFERFTQVEESTTRNYEGIGLGLALVERITREMGGNVIVTSEVGSGSTFTVALPVVSGASDAEENADAADQISRIGAVIDHALIGKPLEAGT